MDACWEKKHNFILFISFHFILLHFISFYLHCICLRKKIPQETKHHFREFWCPKLNLLILWAKCLTISIFTEMLSLDFSQKYLEEVIVDIVHWRGCGRRKRCGQSREDCIIIHISEVRLILALLKLLQCRNQHGCALTKWMKTQTHSSSKGFHFLHIKSSLAGPKLLSVHIKNCAFPVKAAFKECKWRFLMCGLCLSAHCKTSI